MDKKYILFKDWIEKTCWNEIIGADVRGQHFHYGKKIEQYCRECIGQKV